MTDCLDAQKSEHISRHASIDPLMTTHQVAKIIGAEPTSVIRWYDLGHLQGWRTPGGHRRVLQSSVIEYLTSRGLPVPQELCSSAPADTEKVDDSRRRLMWVDDDARFLLGVNRALRPYDAQIQGLLLDDPIEALLEVADFRPHLVLLDVKMPGVDGLRVCRSLKSMPDFAGVGVIMVTGYDDDTLREEADDAGADAVFSKPVSVAELLEPLGVVDRTSGAADFLSP